MWKNIWCRVSTRTRSRGSSDARREPLMLKRVTVYLSFVRFSHSGFALPFALAGALLAARLTPVTWPVIGWILVAMVAPRAAAMGFNRLVDAGRDPLNPTTAAGE